MDYPAVLAFWFDEIEPEAWWKKDVAFDHLLSSRFGAVHEMAAAGELSGWRESGRDGWLKLSCWTSSRAISIGTVHALSPATAWHWYWHRRPSAQVRIET
jgi:hypothetical protein